MYEEGDPGREAREQLRTIAGNLRQLAGALEARPELCGNWPGLAELAAEVRQIPALVTHLRQAITQEWREQPARGSQRPETESPASPGSWGAP